MSRLFSNPFNLRAGLAHGQQSFLTALAHGTGSGNGRGEAMKRERWVPWPGSFWNSRVRKVNPNKSQTSWPSNYRAPYSLHWTLQLVTSHLQRPSFSGQVPFPLNKHFLSFYCSLFWQLLLVRFVLCYLPILFCYSGFFMHPTQFWFFLLYFVLFEHFIGFYILFHIYSAVYDILSLLCLTIYVVSFYFLLYSNSAVFLVYFFVYIYIFL